MATPKPSNGPMFRALELIANKWVVPILHYLQRAQGPVRFRELQRQIGRITQKELTKRLRQLERNGLVQRKVFAEVPPRVEYRVTRLGRTLVKPLSELACWAEKYSAALDEKQRQFDARAAARLRYDAKAGRARLMATASATPSER